MWYLPYLEAAKGGLKEVIDGDDKKTATQRAITYLCEHASFGSLEVSVQRAAMTID